jgi:hypothetical protein
VDVCRNSLWLQCVFTTDELWSFIAKSIVSLVTKDMLKPLAVHHQKLQQVEQYLLSKSCCLVPLQTRRDDNVVTATEQR